MERIAEKIKISNPATKVAKRTKVKSVFEVLKPKKVVLSFIGVGGYRLVLTLSSLQR